MQVDFGKAPISDVVQIRGGENKTQGAQKGPMILEKSVNTSQKVVLANDHEAGCSNSKDQDTERYLQPRWCLLAWTHT
jgi:hypothetical protein